jgi:ABC-2 type transport system ATP-binding protein
MIEASGLTREFGSRVAVDNLDLKVKPGEVLGFLGPNGAGKTTTIRMLAGILGPSRGYATIAGIRCDQEPERVHEVVGLLTELPGFYDRLGARRNLEYFGRFYARPDLDTRIEQYLKLMDLWPRRDEPVGRFSKGMKQRLALVRAVLHEPQVLLLDEPTAGLDPESAGEVRNLVLRLRGQGRTVFLSTHNLEEAEQLCDRIAVFRTRLVALDAPANLRQRLFRRRVVVQLEVVDPGVVAALQALPFVQSAEVEGERVTVGLEGFDRNRPALVEAVVRAGGRILSVAEQPHSLEEIYLSLLHEDGKSA